MKYWLMKSEPDVWSIDQQKKAGSRGATWDGVRNYQAAKNLKSMKKGDQCFFYHSNIGKEIVGIVEVKKEAYLDKTDKTGRFVAVTVKFLKKLKKPVSLDKIKEIKELSHLSLNLTVTATKRPDLSVLSRYASLITSTIPTISFPIFE